MKRLHELCRLSSAAILDLARRNDSRQLPHRLLERDVRVGLHRQQYTMARRAVASASHYAGCYSRDHKFPEVGEHSALA